MAIARAADLRRHLRKLSEKKLRDLHRTANNAAMLYQAADEEGKTTHEADTIRDFINAEYTRRGFDR